MSFLLQWIFFSNSAMACATCGFGDDGSRWGFIFTTALMTVVPLAFIGGTLLYLKKKSKAADTQDEG